MEIVVFKFIISLFFWFCQYELAAWLRRLKCSPRARRFALAMFTALRAQTFEALPSVEPPESLSPACFPEEEEVPPSDDI
jgi:hypothetical protein